MAHVTWNPADCSPNIVLTNGNATATKGPNGDYSGVRGTVSYSTGLFYFEATVPSDNEGSVGLATAAASLDGPLGYDNPEGIGLYDDGTLWMNWDSYDAVGSGAVGDTRVGFLVDLSARRLWVRNSAGTWFQGGDPNAGGAGIDISLLTADLFPMMTGYYVDDTSTLYSNPETITLGLPTGAVLWGDEGDTDPPIPTRKAIRSIYWF